MKRGVFFEALLNVAFIALKKAPFTKEGDLQKKVFSSPSY